MQSSDDVGNQPGAQLGDLVLEQELALLQALQLQAVLARVDGQPVDDVVKIVVLDLERLQTLPDLRLLLFRQWKVRHREKVPIGPGIVSLYSSARKTFPLRRNDHDVTDSIRTTDPAAVAAEVVRIYRALFDPAPAPKAQLVQAFRDATAFYQGRHPEFCACDTAYHDLQHVLDVTLTMARLLDGYERGRCAGDEPLTPQAFVVGTLAALFHDFGYLRRRNDHTHAHGAEYTLTHVSRSAAYLRGYARALGMEDKSARAAGLLVHYTGYERPLETIRIDDPLLRRVGQMLGTADIIAQMADRCYLEKCRDRLYGEFVLGGLPGFSSAQDLLHKTPLFYQSAAKRLDQQLARSYELAQHHFGGDNPYLDEIGKNIRYAQTVADTPDAELRRQPPGTLPDA